MTPQELKNSILWNAIQGKLTKQNKMESAQQIVPTLFRDLDAPDDTYFDIPDNWCWCKIGKIFKLVNGKAFKPADWSEKGLPIVRIQNLNDMNAPYNYFSGDIEDKYILSGGELLFSWSGTPGTSFGAYIWEGGKAVLNQHIFIVYPQIEMDYRYVKYALNGELKIFIDKAHGGAGLKHITKKEFEGCLLPVPPLAEQKRIVAKIEELLPYIDRYEQAWSKLEQFNSRFPEDMKKSLLQYAIQGKLVEQRPEEGTAEELFTQIQEEKQRLIAEKKIKKEKPLPEIIDDDKPFDIPESWKWVRIGSLLHYIDTGKSFKCDEVPPTEDKCGIIKVSAVTWGQFKENESKTCYSNDLWVDEYAIHKNDFLICRANTAALVGGCVIVEEISKSLMLSDKVLRLHFSQLAYSFYILWALRTPIARNQFSVAATGTSDSMKNISQDTIKNIVIPLPPLAEQKRIVEKLEQLLPLCERLK